MKRGMILAGRWSGAGDFILFFSLGCCWEGVLNFGF